MDTTVQHQNTIQTSTQLSIHNHETNRKKEIPGMHITINVTESCADTPDCITAEEIRTVNLKDEHLSTLAKLKLHSWLSTRTELQKQLQSYRSFMDEIAIIDENTIKRRRVIISASLQEKAINGICTKHMDIDKKNKDASM